MSLKRVKVTKLGPVDNPRDGIYGYGDTLPYHIGEYTTHPVIGERFLARGLSFAEEGIITSLVTEIINENEFKTLNSHYKWEFIED